MAGLAVLLATAVAIPIGLSLPWDENEPLLTAGPQQGTGTPVAAAQARQQAKSSGKEVEVTAEAGPTSSTWAQPDGAYKLRLTSAATRAKVGNEWKPIDTTLERVDGGFAPKAANGHVVFSAGTATVPAATGEVTRASRGVSRVSQANPAAVRADTPDPQWSELVRLNANGHDLVLSWPGPLPAPFISGPRALYENIRPGIDLVMTAQDGGYSHLVVVKDKQAAQDPMLGQLNYRLTSPNLTFHLDGDSRSVSARDAKGEEVAGAPTPYMWDSAGEVALTEGEPVPQPPSGTAQHPTLGLKGLLGAEGAHAKVADASLSPENVLTLTPNAQLLNDADTVYPVFIDPSFKGHKQNWTLLYKTQGSSSFWNGQNFNTGSGAIEARVGYEDKTHGTSRSVFAFDFGSQLHGTQIRSANLRALQTYSYSCSATAFDVYHTPAITSSSTWDNTGGFWGKRIAGASTGYGWNSSCPDAWVGVDIKSTVEEGARGAWQSLTLGLRSTNESNPNFWKKFLANGESAPFIEVEYTRVPNTPVKADMSTVPGGECTTQAPIVKIGKTDVIFKAKASDGDGNLRQLNFRVWSSSGSTVDVFDDTNDGFGEVTVGWEKFTPGVTYYWLAQAVDWDGQWSGSGPLDSGGGGWCGFTVDHTQPTAPTIRSEDFPAPGPDGAEWSKNTLGPGKITVIAGGTNPADIREFQWSLNHPIYDQKAVPAAGQDTVTVDVNPDNAGPNLFYVRIVSKAGNVSNPFIYTFYVRPRPGLDGRGDVTGDQKADLLVVDGAGDLRVYPADAVGDVDAWMPAAIDNGKPAPAGYWKDASGKNALVGHSGDWFPGDGITDLIARMPDGKLYVYQGDGNGRFDISRRTEVLLPAGAPNPATLTQIVVVPDMNGDNAEDIFATAGDTLWILTGYTGASITEARQLSATSWTKRDIIDVRDVSGDGVPDLTFRDDADPNRGLALRRGKPGTNGGADINSLALAVNSADGKDLPYGTTGWDSASWPLLRGTPDVNNDGIPDMYLTKNDGTLHLYHGGRSALGGGWRVEEDDWNTFQTLG